MIGEADAQPLTPVLRCLGATFPGAARNADILEFLVFRAVQILVDAPDMTRTVGLHKVV
jgi:hypothetical protein